MSRIARSLAVLTAMLALALPAHAAGSLTRTFVSSAGVDSNPCTVTAPCASFAAAYAAVQVNGIVAALDPGKYGPLTITAGVTINGNGWSAITAPASGTGITINASTANVALIGLEIDGAGAGYNGIMVNSAGGLTVTNCTLQNFVINGSDTTTGNGILMQPSSGTLNFTITGTTASNNNYAGVYYFPAGGSPNANGVIDHVVANADTNGIIINTANTSGGTTVVAVSNSIASNNSSGGVVDQNSASSTIKMSVDNVTASGNVVGINANGINAGGASASMLLGRSVIVGNSDYGVLNTTTPGTLYTYQDNRINLNGITDIQGTPLSTTFPKQ
jgi:hypothetical protein